MSLFLALDHGPAFAAAAARGSIASVAAGCAYAVTYARLQRGWPTCLATASAAYVVVALALRPFDLPAPMLAALMTVVLLVAGRLVPRRSSGEQAAPPPPWDLPARVVLATTLVVVIPLAAPILGPYGSAVAASFPLFASILGVFAQRVAGHAAASEVMRGLIRGLFGFLTFFLVVALALERLGMTATYLGAAVGVLVVQAVTLTGLRRA